MGLDEAHAAHVGSEVVDVARALRGAAAFLALLEVELQVVDVGKALVPLIEGLDVHRAQPPQSLAAKIANQVAADEAAAPSDHNGIALADHDLTARMREAVSAPPMPR